MELGSYTFSCNINLGKSLLIQSEAFRTHFFNDRLLYNKISAGRFYLDGVTFLFKLKL